MPLNIKPWMLPSHFMFIELETCWQERSYILVGSSWSVHEEEVGLLLHNEGIQEHVGTPMTFICVSQYSLAPF